MHRYGSHQGEVRGLPHYPVPAKTFGVFYALVSESRRQGNEGRERRNKGGIEKQDNEGDECDFRRK